MTNPPNVLTEVIAFSSGKGGTGKTSIIGALGYALTYSGHSVLMIDADRATDGLSLFVLGPDGMNQIAGFNPQNTFSGIVEAFETSRGINAQPLRINRSPEKDHGLFYQAIISGKDLYGDGGRGSFSVGQQSTVQVLAEHSNRQFDRMTFQQCVQQLFQYLRDEKRYDYVLVDTRGGFSFESTDVAAAADSLILVTEASNTNFYQDRNLLDRINDAASQMRTKSLLRGVIVNKATDGLEMSFRHQLTKEFGLRLEDTFSIALDLEATAAYKTQRVIYSAAPASRFAYDSLQAFGQILKVVTSQWPEGRARRWNELVANVDTAIAKHNAAVEAEKQRIQEQIARFEALDKECVALKTDLANVKSASEQEKRRQDILLNELKEQSKLRERMQEVDRARETERLEMERSEQSKAVKQITEQFKITQEQLKTAQERIHNLERELHLSERDLLTKEYSLKERSLVLTERSKFFYVIIAVVGTIGLVSIFLLLQQLSRYHAEAIVARAEMMSENATNMLLSQALTQVNLANSNLQIQVNNLSRAINPLRTTGMFRISCNRLDMCADLLIQGNGISWKNGVCGLPSDVPGGPSHAPTVIQDEDWKEPIRWFPVWPTGIEKGYRCQNCSSGIFELPRALIPESITITNVLVLDVTGPFTIDTFVTKGSIVLHFHSAVGTIDATAASIYWYGTLDMGSH
jgi:MinD-like ATPase involved in chromosome partitioning or flagellar assembly